MHHFSRYLTRILQILTNLILFGAYMCLAHGAVLVFSVFLTLFPDHAPSLTSFADTQNEHSAPSRVQNALAAIAGKETAPPQAFQPVLEAPSSPNALNGHSDDASTYSMMLARGNACLRMVDVCMQLKGSTVLYNTVHLAQGLLGAVQDHAATHPGFMPPQHFRELMQNPGCVTA